MMKVLCFLAFAALASAEIESYQQGSACYGFGGGHGVWICGSSKAYCNELGGYFYAEGYVSSRSQACMCETGCPEGKVVPGFTKPDSPEGHGCYGAGGGHAVQCSVTTTDCEAQSGSVYAVDAKASSHSGAAKEGCCLCKANCNHTSEPEGKDCTAAYNDPVSSPAPPPLPPSPPPSPMFPPAVAEGSSYETVTFGMEVSGDLSDYTDSKKTMIADKVAVLCGVVADDITVSFSSGSVIITVTIKVADATKAAAVKTVIDTNMATPADALAAMGGKFGSILYNKDVLAVQPVVVASIKVAGSGLSTGALVGIIVGAVVGAIVILGVVYLLACKGKAVAAKGTSA